MSSEAVSIHPTMSPLDLLTPLDVARNIALGFRQAAALTVLVARQNWRRIDAVVIRWFDEQAQLAANQAATMRNLLGVFAPAVDAEGTDEHLMLVLVREIAAAHGQPRVGPNLARAAADILHERVDLRHAAQLVIAEGPASMARVRELAGRVVQMGGAPPPQLVGIGAAMALPWDQLTAILGGTTAAAPPPVAPAAPAPPPAAPPGAPEEEPIYRALCKRLEDDIAAGKVTPERVPTLRRILESMWAVMNMPAETWQAMTTRRARLKELQDELLELVSRPITANPSLRSTRVRNALGELEASLLAEAAMPFTASSVRDRISNLLVRLSPVLRALEQAGADDAQTVSLEATQARDLALEAKRVALLSHAMTVDPIFTCSTVRRSANTVFYSGGDAVAALVRLSCERRRMTLLQGVAQGEVAQVRFDQLRACHVCVADLTSPATPTFATACYDLGIALVLGRPLVVLVSEGSSVPFDVDVEPVALGGRDAEADRKRLSEALDRAVLTLQRSPARGGHERTVDALAQRYQGSNTPHASLILDELSRSKEDPQKITELMESLFGLDPSRAPLLVHATWPAFYPDEGARRLFHVMPFRPAWAAAVRDRVEACCKGRVQYRRHDRVEDAHVIRSLWEELCRATHVLVDLTDMNPNVAIELGIAHALGKPTLMVGQAGTVSALIPSLRKLRVTEYALVDGRLEAAVDRHLQGA